MKKRYKILLLILTLGGLALTLAALVLPWKIYAAQRLQTMLEARGFENVTLTLGDVGLRHATLHDVTVGTSTPLTLQKLTIAYTPRDLWQGRLQSLTADNLSLTARQTETGWQLEGLKRQDSIKPFTLPDTRAALAMLPLHDFTLENGLLNIVTAQWRTSTAFDATWQDYTLTIPVKTLSYNAKNISASTTGGTVALALTDETGWQGTWRINDIALSGGPALPPLQAEGTLAAQHNRLLIKGAARSPDQNIQTTFTLTHDLSTTPSLTINSAQMNWKGGTLSIRDTEIPLSGTAPYNFTVQARDISIDDLMQSLTGKRVSATGTVSGTIPVRIARDGTITLGKGTLTAAGPGTITMPPDALPGDNPQIALTRQILELFNYQSLTIASTPENGETAIILALEGHNPDVYNGRAVKLNVRLTGDILDFVRQNVILLTSPETLITQDQP